MAAKKSFKISGKWQRRGVSVLIIVLAFLAFLLLFDKVLMPWYVKRGEVTVLPKVVGKQVDDAMKILKDAGYEPIKYETQFDDKAKEGVIIRQTPEGGDETKPGRKVYLIVSGGKEMVIVPNLIGQSLRDARILLVKANLDLNKQEMAFSDSIASGMVLGQSPPAGTKISSDQKVNITVSSGSRAGKVEVPNVTDIMLSEAILRLGNIKLGVGAHNFIPSDKKSNTVVDQSPKAGEFVTEGSYIDLWISQEKVIPPVNEN
jgi:serine/threonine-protein kinase